MDKLTFFDPIGDREFSVLNSAEPVITICGYYSPLKEIFPYVTRVNWGMGYMVASGRVMPAMEASDFIKSMTWLTEKYVLSKFN